MTFSPSSRLTSTRLDNGLEVHLLTCHDAPVVTTALTYRAGAIDEPTGRSGVAHFLEHMMFKGSRRFGPGEIDHRTRRLGGTNNAFTSHDTTTYYFSFGADRWREALDLEADRMRGLRLDPVELESERSVILEEIAMYESEPWDALERAVQARRFGDNPYGCPILGRAEEVSATDAADLARFHRAHYRPGNAVLVVAGAVDPTELEAVRTTIGAVPAEAPSADAPAREPAIEALEPPRPDGCERVVLERGQVARLLFAFPAPPVDHADLAGLRLLSAILATGRSSRLNDRLVERDGLCAWVSAAVGEARYGGSLQIAAELTPGSEPAEVEELVLRELERLRDQVVEGEPLRRAVRLVQADWVFAHERVESQALTLCQAAALVSPRYADEQLAAIAALDGGRLRELARRYLDPGAGSVLGWSLRRGAGREAVQP